MLKIILWVGMSNIFVCRNMSEYLVIYKLMFFDNHPMCGDAIKIYCAMFLCNVGGFFCFCFFLFFFVLSLLLFVLHACRHENV